MAHGPDLPDSTNGTPLSAKRWDGITRDYTPEDVARLRGSVQVTTRWRSSAPSACGSS